MRVKMIIMSYMVLTIQTAVGQNTFPPSGNVGIGTASPSHLLDVNGGDVNIHSGNAYRVNGQYGLFWNVANNAIGIGTTNNFPVNIFANALTPRLSIKTSGNIGIGTTDPQSKLAVNGTVTAKQVKVTQTGWPDYVFDSAYHLPPFLETEAFIAANHHLPGIPSAEEIENNGLDLGDMQKKQMQKIEEMMLYLIEQNRIIQSQQQEIDSLKDQMKSFKANH